MAVRVLAGLIAACPSQAKAAFIHCGVRLVGQIEPETVRCERTTAGQRRGDLELRTTSGQQVCVEAKIDSAADADQLLQYPDTATKVLLVWSSQLPDVVTASKEIGDAAKTVEWGELLVRFRNPMATLLAGDVARIATLPSAKTGQRKALSAALLAGPKPRGWDLELNPGSTGFPSIIITPTSGEVLAQVEGPRNLKSPLTFKGTIGFQRYDERQQKELPQRLKKLEGALTTADLLEISQQQSDSTQRAATLGLKPWLTRGYGDGYIGVKTVSFRTADEALKSTIEITKIFERVVAAEEARRG